MVPLMVQLAEFVDGVLQSSKAESEAQPGEGIFGPDGC